MIPKEHALEACAIEFELYNEGKVKYYMPTIFRDHDVAL